MAEPAYVPGDATVDSAVDEVLAFVNMVLAENDVSIYFSVAPTQLGHHVIWNEDGPLTNDRC